MSSYVDAALRKNEAPLRCPQNVETGQWEPIENIRENKYVQEIGRFTVMEHNKQTGANLNFMCVESGDSQVVEGMNYLLILKAAKGELIWPYRAMVYANESEGSWKFISFEPLRIKN